jgi:hypothetical protein
MNLIIIKIQHRLKLQILFKLQTIISTYINYNSLQVTYSDYPVFDGLAVKCLKTVLKTEVYPNFINLLINCQKLL